MSNSGIESGVTQLGVYWNWDPRETATLILWLAYLGYFFLRMSVENVERRASRALAAQYSMDYVFYFFAVISAVAFARACVCVLIKASQI